MILTPASRACRAWSSSRSSRASCALISMATPAAAAAANTAPCRPGAPRASGPSRPDADGRARPPTGIAIARSSRSVICAASWPNAEWSDAIDDVELGQAVVGEVHRAVGADVALDAGEQREAVEPLADLANRAGVRERAASSRPLAIASAWL